MQGRTPPCTVNVSAGLPAPAVVGDTEAIVGGGNPPVGVARVSGNELDVPSELDAVTLAVPASAVLAAGMEAVSCVALMKTVVCTAPFQFTTASLVKFVPFTVSVKP